MQQALSNLTGWRDVTLPTTEVWLTEFGYVHVAATACIYSMHLPLLYRNSHSQVLHL
jgi:hypothetical protein